MNKLFYSIIFKLCEVIVDVMSSHIVRYSRWMMNCQCETHSDIRINENLFSIYFICIKVKWNITTKVKQDLDYNEKQF